MRIGWFVVAGLGFVGWVSCGDSSNGGDLFNTGAGGTSPTGTAGSNASGSAGAMSPASGASGSGIGTTGAAGEAGNGAGGNGTAGAGGSAGAGPGGSAGMTGTAGAAGAGGSPAGGSAGASGAAGASGSGGSTGGTAGAKPDGGTAGTGGGPIDGGPPDARPDTIRCGNTLCAVATQFCCIPRAEPARCVALVSTNCPDTADRLRCDDRTDCPIGGQVCCVQAAFGTGGASALCRAQGTCGGAGQTQELCEPGEPGTCPGGGTNSCRTDNQSIIPGYATCH